MTVRIPRILCIAGSDSGGGAGIQADIKTATVLGAYAMTAITAVTAQDTTGVHAIHLMPSDLVRAQIIACLDDIGADAIKIGMLGSAEIADIVADVLAEKAVGIPVVLDPVLVSTSGTQLLDRRGVDVVRNRLIPLSTILTPNLPETGVLLGMDMSQDAEAAGRQFLSMGTSAVLIKGGHLDEEILRDVLVTPQGSKHFVHARMNSPHSHGTGCTLATAIAVGLAQGVSLERAVASAVSFVQYGLSSAPGFGRGHGPLNHMHGLSMP